MNKAADLSNNGMSGLIRLGQTDLLETNRSEGSESNIVSRRSLHLGEKSPQQRQSKSLSSFDDSPIKAYKKRRSMNSSFSANFGCRRKISISEQDLLKTYREIQDEEYVEWESQNENNQSLRYINCAQAVLLMLSWFVLCQMNSRRIELPFLDESKPIRIPEPRH